ncbi:MAG: hypothetical protein WC162_12015, partial [Sphaerochaetaceae bacterium]
MKRIIIIFILFICFPIYAENANMFFPSLKSDKILPTHEVIQTLNIKEEDAAVLFLQQALDSDFSYEWVEKYFYEGTKEALTRVFTNFFNSNLPLKKSDYLIGKIIYENSMTSI